MSDQVPFSNGTEGRAWMGVWCDLCANDHANHHDEAADGEWCLIIGESMCAGDDWRWPEAWLKPPPALDNHLPSLMVCGQFEPCEKGTCCGDTQAEIRERVVIAVQDGWKAAL